MILSELVDRCYELANEVGWDAEVVDSAGSPTEIELTDGTVEFRTAG